MQTFLPFESFSESARCLDRQRLGKQRVETLQILKALDNPLYGWQSHPSVLMWKGFSQSLVLYGLDVCKEWISRGYSDSCLVKISLFRDENLPLQTPWWLGREEFHSSHRASLLAKNSSHYGQFGWSESPKLGYWWPSEHLKEV